MSYDITLLAAPGFLLFIAIELLVDRARKTGYYRLNDSFGSLALGIFSKSTGLIQFSLMSLILSGLLAPWSLPNWSLENPWVWVGIFVLYDFVYYWSHRFRHEINFLWAGHSIHHSSEDYNLTTALRQTSSSVFVWVFSVPAFLLGVPVEAWVVCGAWNLIYQFWVHTRHIKTLGPMEWVMVTPSHHRVHHAQNARYIDKNHGGVFILWDRLFGTYAKEVDDEEIIYGVRRPVLTLNPITANFHVWASLAKDAWHTKSVKDKLRIWFMPTGWRPEDVIDAHPIEKTNLEHFEKYDPQSSKQHARFALMHLLSAMVIGSVFLFENKELSYGVAALSWLLISAPLVVGAWILEGSSLKLEAWRLALSWPLFIVLSPLYGTITYWCIASALVLSSLIWLTLMLGERGKLSEA